MTVIKLSDIAPAVAQRIAADEAHRRTCRKNPCVICGREDLRRSRRDTTSAFMTAAREDAVARIPPSYGGASLDASWLAELVGHEAVDRARSAITEPTAAFLGPPGAGKSSLAAAMFRAAVAAETVTTRLHRMRWLSAHKLAKARAGQPLGEGEAPVVEAALDATLLVLDELGGEDPRYASAVAEVLYERHEQALATWVTTGVSAKEIAARYGGGIARRVFEGAAVFRLAGRK